MNVTKSATVSVLFPVYNAERYVAESLYSILAQTYPDFEVIAVNDGSSDNSLAVLQAIAKTDSRVKVIDQANQGLVKTLNHAASLARGRYLARMDSDDVSLPDRFQLQVELLESNPELVLVAGCFEVMDHEGEYIYREIVPSRDHDLKRALYVRNPIAHGSVMFRRDAFEQLGGYSANCGPTEDYELWSRMAALGEFAAIDRTIFRWRVNPGGITSTKQKLVERHMNQNIDAYWITHPPQVLSARELRASGRSYMKLHKKHGTYMKLRVTADNIQLGVKLVRRRQIKQGLSQLYHVTATGRAGMRMTAHKLRIIAGNLIRHRGLEDTNATTLAVKPTARVKDTADTVDDPGR